MTTAVDNLCYQNSVKMQIVTVPFPQLGPKAFTPCCMESQTGANKVVQWFPDSGATVAIYIQAIRLRMSVFFLLWGKREGKTCTEKLSNS